jgi:hypothetical protein
VRRVGSANRRTWFLVADPAIARACYGPEAIEPDGA